MRSNFYECEDQLKEITEIDFENYSMLEPRFHISFANLINNRLLSCIELSENYDNQCNWNKFKKYHNYQWLFTMQFKSSIEIIINPFNDQNFKLILLISVMLNLISNHRLTFGQIFYQHFMIYTNPYNKFTYYKLRYSLHDLICKLHEFIIESKPIIASCSIGDSYPVEDLNLDDLMHINNLNYIMKLFKYYEIYNFISEVK